MKNLQLLRQDRVPWSWVGLITPVGYLSVLMRCHKSHHYESTKRDLLIRISVPNKLSEF
jgi:hypothetical protein